MHCAQNGSIKCIKILLNEQNTNSNNVLSINHCDKLKRSAFLLMYACLGKHIDIVKLLLDRIINSNSININLQDSKGLTAIMLALESKCVDIIRLLILQPNIDLRLQDNTGQTCLIFAAKGGNNYSQFIDEMIEHGANINNIQHVNGLTAIMWAAFLGHENAVKLLIKDKCDINIVSSHGSNVLHFASARNPTDSPTQSPTAAPTRKPTEQPSYAPSNTPTFSPTESSARAPTTGPTPVATDQPTDSPSGAPTDSQTPAPSPAPTDAPTSSPTSSPINPTHIPVNAGIGDHNSLLSSMIAQECLVLCLLFFVTDIIGTKGSKTIVATAGLGTASAEEHAQVKQSLKN